MQRVSVVGPSGSGKTTIAAHISRILDLPNLELDSVHWQPDWTPLDRHRLRSLVDEFTEGDRWVIDGNYSSVRDLITARADTVVWLRYGRALVMRRLVKRSIARVATRRPLWNGNTETLRDLLDIRDPEHIVRWSWNSFATLDDRYRNDMDDRSLSHLSWIVLEALTDTERFLDALSAT